jgi:tRNA threonylcarbamoyladenosine biosynthesis protein TsaE
MEYETKNSSETVALGREVAQGITPGGKAVIFGLRGELGAGKTTFIQGFAEGLKVKEKILSPTFVIINRYGISLKGLSNFYHFDCYRIEDEKEMDNLGFGQIISNPENIVCIEWSENIKGVLPEDITMIDFSVTGENERKIKIIHGKQ